MSSQSHSYRDIAARRGRVDERDVFVVRNGPRAGEIVFHWDVPCRN
ncbi:MAG: hypothetical protein MZU79_06930 [Anaerotruncus sp.]|nr:hypothetical protein [Anaerotruncus sp.]